MDLKVHLPRNRLWLSQNIEFCKYRQAAKVNLNIASFQSETHRHNFGLQPDFTILQRRVFLLLFNSVGIVRAKVLELQNDKVLSNTANLAQLQTSVPKICRTVCQRVVNFLLCCRVKSVCYIYRMSRLIGALPVKIYNIKSYRVLWKNQKLLRFGRAFR